MSSLLVALTSARRVSKLRALTSDPPYTVFFKDKVRLRAHPAFLPKVMSDFHTSQDIFLPVFYPKPHMSGKEQALHTLDMRRALAFYLDRTKPFRKSLQLIVAIAERVRGQPMSSQWISSCITACIRECYALAGISAPPLRAHSTRAVAASTAFMTQVHSGHLQSRDVVLCPYLHQSLYANTSSQGRRGPGQGGPPFLYSFNIRSSSIGSTLESPDRGPHTGRPAALRGRGRPAGTGYFRARGCLVAAEWTCRRETRAAERLGCLSRAAAVGGVCDGRGCSPAQARWGSRPPHAPGLFPGGARHPSL